MWNISEKISNNKFILYEYKYLEFLFSSSLLELEVAKELNCTFLAWPAQQHISSKTDKVVKK